MDLPTDFFVRPLENDPSVIAFTFPFALQGKAVGDDLVQALDNGDLLIEGWAAEFEGEDRQGENFTDGAFKKGIKAFLAGPAALCFHHKQEKVLGKVLELEEVAGRGLRMKARVDGAIKSHPELGTYYAQIKNGTLSALSVGGYFKRVNTPDGPRINDMDFTEISVTGVPVHTKPSFAVIAGKALEDAPAFDAAAAPDFEIIGVQTLDSINSALDNLILGFDRLEGKSVKGDSTDLYFMAMLLKLEQQTNSLSTKKEDGDGAADARVDALVQRVKNYLDSIAREVHSIAAELGPLPSISYMD